MDSVTDIIDNKGDIIVWLILCANLVCFIFITVSYILINITTRLSMKRSGSHQNTHRQKGSREIQNRITFIIVTDFVCWVPFIMVSALHNLHLIDATHWYTTFAMTVLPLNSVINPLLYDNKLRKIVSDKIQLLVSSVSDCWIIAYIRQWLGIEGTQTCIELDMTTIENVASLSQFPEE